MKKWKDFGAVKMSEEVSKIRALNKEAEQKCPLKNQRKILYY